MVRYNIEVKYLSFGKEHTSEVYYNALDNLNEEMEEKQIEFCKSMRENYKEAGKTLEILEYSMIEVNL